MADQRGTLELLADVLGSALAALQDVLRVDGLDTLFLELGLEPPPVGGDAQFVQKLTEAADQCSALEEALTALAVRAEQDDLAALARAVAQVIDAIGTLVDRLDDLATDLKRATSSAPNAAEIAAFAEQMAGRLLEAAAVRYLEVVHPTLQRILALLTLVEVTPLPVPPIPTHTGGGDAASVIAETAETVPLAQRRLHLDRLAELFRDPLAFLKTAYDWGDEAFDGKKLFLAISELFDALGLASVIDEAGDAAGILSFFVLSVAPTADAHPPGIDGLLSVDVDPSAERVLARLDEDWRFSLSAAGALGAGLELRLLPPASLSVLPPVPPLDGEVKLGFVGESPDPLQPFVVFGQQGASRLQARRIEAALLARLRWDPGAGRALADVGFEAKAVEGKVVIDVSKSDGFLKSVLPRDGITFGFGFDLGWTAERGFFFSGSAGLEMALAIGVTLGPVTLEALHLLLGVAPEGLDLALTADCSATVGPVTAVVGGIGLALELAFARGNLGPVDLDVHFKPPSRLGISIDAGPVTGGGYIDFDPENGRYAGVLALSLYGIQVKAIGLLDTRLPGGQEGYSFLIIITAEFSPIQLGFGFTLNGVGGLCGIHRTVVREALQAGLRQHSLDHILFPADPVRNAPQIISDLRTVFPPRAGRFVFGPMLALGWGGGANLVTAELGVILEVPEPVVIVVLGQMHVLLPAADAPVVELHLDVLGIIDFGKKLFSLDATLHDSRIAAFSVQGDMAMRLSWGGAASFALSIGGLNPHFQPPPGFPSLRRLTIEIGNDNLRLSIQTYFAITSNSFQLGAHAEVRAGSGSFNVYGWLGFDALVIFAPFSFVVDFTAGLALRRGTRVLFGISLEGTLSGPTPWHIEGRATISLLFFEIHVRVNETVGSSQTNVLPEVDAWAELRKALQDQRSWSGSQPAGGLQVATLKAPESQDQVPVLVDPSSRIALHQKVLPLNHPLAKLGEASLKDQTLFTVDAVTLGGRPAGFEAETDLFAPGQFEQLSDQQKLSRSSFERMQSGITIGKDASAFGKQYAMDVVYQDIIVDLDGLGRRGGKFTLPLSDQLSLNASGPAARSDLRAAALGKYGATALLAKRVALDDERFVVAGLDDLLPRADITAPSTRAAALAALARHVAAHPQDRGRLQVVPQDELEAA